MKSQKFNPQQLELFTQDFFAALEPSRAEPPQPIFKAPPQIVRPVVPEPPQAPPKRHIQIGQHAVEYELRRSSRRSIGFTIDDEGLTVTAPKRITLAEIDNAIRAKQRWILTKLRERIERRSVRDEKAIIWVDGATLPYLGGELTLKLEDASKSHCVFDPVMRTLTVGVVQGLHEWQLIERVRLWFEEQAHRLFKERLDHYAPRLGVQYSGFSLSSAGTRWGSCTHDRHIRLNWKLMHYSLPLIDYVVAHELAHIRHMNHSPRFWATVGEVFPDYEGARDALKKRSAVMPAVFD